MTSPSKTISIRKTEKNWGETKMEAQRLVPCTVKGAPKGCALLLGRSIFLPSVLGYIYPNSSLLLIGYMAWVLWRAKTLFPHIHPMSFRPASNLSFAEAWWRWMMATHWESIRDFRAKTTPISWSPGPTKICFWVSEIANTCTEQYVEQPTILKKTLLCYSSTSATPSFFVGFLIIMISVEKNHEKPSTAQISPPVAGGSACWAADDKDEEKKMSPRTQGTCHASRSTTAPCSTPLHRIARAEVAKASWSVSQPKCPDEFGRVDCVKISNAEKRDWGAGFLEESAQSRVWSVVVETNNFVLGLV